MELSIYQWMFYGGVLLMIAVAVSGVIIALIAHTSGKRLRKQLEQEYGRKRG